MKLKFRWCSGILPYELIHSSFCILTYLRQLFRPHSFQVFDNTFVWKNLELVKLKFRLSTCLICLVKKKKKKMKYNFNLKMSTQVYWCKVNVKTMKCEWISRMFDYLRKLLTRAIYFLVNNFKVNGIYFYYCHVLQQRLKNTPIYYPFRCVPLTIMIGQIQSKDPNRLTYLPFIH